jgi:hypothetical protein
VGCSVGCLLLAGRTTAAAHAACLTGCCCAAAQPPLLLTQPGRARHPVSPLGCCRLPRLLRLLLLRVVGRSQGHHVRRCCPRCCVKEASRTGCCTRCGSRQLQARAAAQLLAAVSSWPSCSEAQGRLSQAQDCSKVTAAGHVVLVCQGLEI